MKNKEVSLILALTTQLGLLGSPPDPIGCFTMQGGSPGSNCKRDEAELHFLMNDIGKFGGSYNLGDNAYSQCFVFIGLILAG